MREQLIQYVNLLFAGVQDADEMRAEILQNTLDRYDDLVSQGKSPEAAYRLAISGIGDINEILGNRAEPDTPWTRPHYTPRPTREPVDTPVKKVLRAIAIALYILSPIPLFVLSDMGMDTIGLCGTITIVAVATVLIVLGQKHHPEEAPKEGPASPRKNLRESIHSLVWAIGLALYFIVSFATGAWFITWVIFPIIACVRGLISAIMDLKEANDNEN